MRKEIVIVDGYNVIGADDKLKTLAKEDFEGARDELISMLAEYQAYSGREVIVVFDAHRVVGKGSQQHMYNMDIRYTKEKETADECIERLVVELSNVATRIYVATSDRVEQHVTFGNGGLRISAMELVREMKKATQSIRHKIANQQHQPHKNSFDNRLPDDLKEKFEQWRRGNKK
ncbi:NYN domain-containing protein [Longirhabdus pacifica]|uniref:NYN domain-containing protein n=1 Tax=Longirhabdus pacifica TaxID=2305227 RepID=UPI00100911DF|nr:NYN domain-containing protein [Longirhabdus pacifica]